MWPSEPRDFTPWLAGNLDYLADLELGPLTLIGIEAPLPETQRALDILAETADERKVAIENQFGEADHDHLTRGLAYAVGHGAAVLVVVAEKFHPEFAATAAYLNHAAESLGLDAGGIGVYLVEVSVEALDEWYLPRFRVVEGPNRWLSDTAPERERRRLPSVQAFLELVSSDRVEVIREILEDWSSRPGASVTHEAQAAVALRLKKPAGPGTVAALTPQKSGTIWLNRGYLVSAFEPAGGTAEEIDQMIRSTWPSARAGEKGYYFIVSEPTLPEYRAFADALLSLWNSSMHDPG